MRRGAFSLVVAVVVAASALSAVGAVAGAQVSVSRCGFIGSRYGRLGLYPTKGHVSCAQAAFLIHRMFTHEGTYVGAGQGRYSDGWVCGGQMGRYFCRYPFSGFATSRYSKVVDAQACDVRDVGCPAHAREEAGFGVRSPVAYGRRAVRRGAARR